MLEHFTSVPDNPALEEMHWQLGVDGWDQECNKSDFYNPMARGLVVEV